jgi:hypothetical protein
MINSEELEGLDLLEFLDGLDIEYETAGKNIGPGWAAINPCPNKNCGDDRNHFAINIGTKAINCWVCGYSGTIIKFLMVRYGIDQEQAENIIMVHMEEADLVQDLDLETLVHKTFSQKVKKIDNIPPTQILKYLPGSEITGKMLQERPKLDSFLKKRKISLELCKRFRLRYDYKKSLRLIAPIKSADGKQIIAYQGRDVTGKAMLPYITQPKDAPLGTTLFNISEWKHRKNERTAIVVEGFIDAIVTVGMIEKHHKRKASKICVLACFRNKPTLDQARLLADASVILSFLDHDSWWNKREFDECCSEVERVEAIPLPVGKDPAELIDDEFLELDIPSYLP